jgi:hypothetical protein
MTHTYLAPHVRRQLGEINAFVAGASILAFLWFASGK